MIGSMGFAEKPEVTFRRPSSSDFKPETLFSLDQPDLTHINSARVIDRLEEKGFLEDLLLSSIGWQDGQKVTVEFDSLQDKLKDLTVNKLYLNCRLNEQVQGKSVKEHVELSFKKMLSNKICYTQNVLQNLKKDLSFLAEKFNFNPSQVSGVQLKFPGADVHNHGKSPVFITLNFHSCPSQTFVYKPRMMDMEKAICDSTQSFFVAINKHFEMAALPTYGVLAFTDQDRCDGYSEFIEGPLVYDEEAYKGMNEFFEPNEGVEDIENFLSVYKKGNQDENLELATTTFFWERNEEQLGQDFLLFQALEQVQAADLHGGNFIFKEGKLIPIDLEVFNDPSAFSAADILKLIDCVYKAKKWPIPDYELANVFQSYLAELEHLKNRVPTRYLPVGTETFEQMRNDHLLGKNISKEINDLIGQIEEDGFVIKMPINILADKIKSNFLEVEIPYFTKQNRNVYFDNELVAEKAELAVEEKDEW